LHQLGYSRGPNLEDPHTFPRPEKETKRDDSSMTGEEKENM
jgi:hypothetical protein